MRSVDESERIAFINTTDIEGKSAMFYVTACRHNKFPKPPKLLDVVSHPSVEDPQSSMIFLLSMALHGMGYCTDADESLRVVTKLLESGCDPKSQDAGGQTVLHFLAGTRQCVSFEQFADELLRFVDEPERILYVNTKDTKGKSAIFYATNSSVQFPTSRIRKLLDLGADPNSKDKGGQTALHGFVAEILTPRKLEAIYLLSEAGIDMNVADHAGRTALHVATASPYCSVELVSLLLWCGVDGNLQDEHGQTALQVFIANATILPVERRLHQVSLKFPFLKWKHAVNIVSVLLEQGVDGNLQDKSGRTALHLVTRKSEVFPIRTEILTVLLESGTDPTIADNEGHLPLNYLGDPKKFDSTAAFLLFRHMVTVGY